MSDDGGESARRAIEAWAASGAMSLTGRADGPPLGPPEPLVPGLSAIADVVAQRSSALGSPVRLDPLGLLSERAAIAGLHRQGTTSCGGATRLLPCADGWFAVSLARDDDLELVPAWLGIPALGGADPWAVVAGEVECRRGATLVEQAALLGLPVSELPAAVPDAPVARAPLAPLPCRARRFGDRTAATALEGVVVVDLGSLWAGPLCGSILADAGAAVVKVESTGRPDGARQGPAAFFDLLNAGKRSVALDLRNERGRRLLAALLARADVVIEASRPRALEQLGVDAAALLGQADGPRVWCSITGHGREGSARDRVGFGDDAAVAGGLVTWEDGAPRFCADAAADPATGLTAAAAVLDALAAGGTWLLDVALAGVAAHLAGPTLPVPADVVAAPAAARRVRGHAAALGADTAAVLAELGLA
ncbi:MAG TPA: CoA transferase [Acidimicrobiales bacterium]|nr:CoA transferase [Acidimicrobiales bacterium]